MPTTVGIRDNLECLRWLCPDVGKRRGEIIKCDTGNAAIVVGGRVFR
jgi:hypothetical protein